jgi:peptide/histidine transporter 3/4
MAENENEYECQESCNMESRGSIAMDGSVDLKGKSVLRSKTGRWKACSFLVGYEIFERMAFYGIVSNLVIYLTTKLHEGTLNSAKNVNNWSGAIWITPILGAYIADTHWGRYWTFTVSSCVYILGMIILTLAVSLSSLRPPDCRSDSNVCEKASKLQIGVFYFGLYLIAVGNGGTKPNISTMGADQFDEFDPTEKRQKASFFNWWLFGAFIGTLFGQTFLIYIQENVGFSLGYGIPTAGIIISSVIFSIGTPFYRHKVRKGNPFGRMAQVIVAAARKRRVNMPSDPAKLHEVDPKQYVAQGRFPIHHTPSIRFLDKAATNDGSTSPWEWKLCSVTQVEETKLMIKMLPIWVAMFMPSAVIAQVNTLFIRQGTTLNRHMGSHFEIPAGSVTSFVTMSFLIFLVVYDRILVKTFRKFTGNRRGITILQRIGIGLAIHTLVMVVATITEIKRIRVVKAHGLEGNPKAVAPLTIFILLPQYFLMGIAEAFLEVGKLEFFYDQAPESMQSIGTALVGTTIGIGNFISSFLLTVTTKITGRKGHTNWVLNNLNASRLYYYYALLAVLNVLNFVFFLVVSRFYVYKRETNEAFGNDNHGHMGAVTVEPLALPLDIKAGAYENEQQSMETLMLTSQGK